MKSAYRFLVGTAITIAAALLLLWEPARNRLQPWAGMRETEPPAANTMQVQFIDVGNADAILIRTDDVVIMIDAGENDDETTVSDYLYRQGITQIDLLIATHADADHIGGMDALVRTFPVRRLVHALDLHKTDPDVVALLAAVSERGVAVGKPSIKSTYSLDGIHLEIFGPPAASKETNDHSLVLKLTFGTVTFLFTGDASAVVEEQLLDMGLDLSADVLKVSHHGSSTATTEPFLRAVAPDLAIISCGTGNNHGHPAETVLGRLAAYEVDVLRTDLHGTVILETDGKTIEIVSPKK